MKVFMVILLILTSILHIILAEVDKNYWMYTYHNYSLIDILGIIDYSLQLYIITREHKKKTKRSWSILGFWCINSAITLITVILVLIYDQTVGILVLIFKTIALIVLVILTLAIEEKLKTNNDLN